MKNLKSLLIIAFLFISKPVISQTNISGIINTYTKVNSIAYLSCVDSISVTSTTGFSAGDSVLLIQMKGASIDTTNTIQFGTIYSLGACGNYEFLKISSINGNVIHFTSGIQRQYDINGSVQLVTKPVYTDAIVNATLTAQQWNGTTGGVLTFSVVNNLTLNANIDVTGKGFLGGSASPNYYNNWFFDFAFGISPGRGGKKGESIAPYFLNKEYGRGAPANGGGGGNDINTGGAGGGNYGAGGHGGNNFFSPDTLWGMRSRSLLSGINLTRIYFGGGGGGGHQDNNTATAGSNGGGIIAIHANNIIGNNLNINASGANVVGAAGIDGAGGAGAGGSIILDVTSFGGTLTVRADGGKGGDQIYQPQCHGNGGGGGGGLICYTHASFPGNVTTSVAGGVKGNGQCNNTPNDAASGTAGGIIYDFHFSDTIQLHTKGLSCFGGSDASAYVTTIGNPPYQYDWTFPDGSHNTNDTIQNLSAGQYSLVLTNAGGCPTMFNFLVMPPSPLIITTLSTNAGCNTLTGTATANATGGTPPYSYSWNTVPVQTTQTISNLGVGNYTVTVIDSMGCDTDTTIAVINQSAANFVISQTPAACESNNGSVTVTTTGGTGPFSYHWTPANDTNLSTITSLTTGLYSVIVTDWGTGCSNSLAIIVNNSSSINANIISSQNATCASGENGSAIVMASGGQPPYSYLWPNGDTTYFTNNLSPGTWVVMVESYEGCRAYAAVTIGYDFPGPSIQLGPDTMPCIGSAYLMDAGQGYASYLWSDNSTNQMLTVSSSGNYSVLVTDSNGCEASDAVTVTYVNCFGNFYVHSTDQKGHTIIYPNPTSHFLNIHIRGIHNNETTVTVMNLLGKDIIKKTEVPVSDNLEVIDLTNYSEGIYIVKVETGGEINSYRIIKQ